MTPDNKNVQAPLHQYKVQIPQGDEQLYNLLKEKCNAANVKWQDLNYCGKHGLVKRLRELLNINDSETDNSKNYRKQA